ncbi:hypothetical protein D3C72_1867120 [compost metagenome]
MPSATARTAAPAKRTAATPRSPASRFENRFTKSAAASPWLYRMPEMMMVISMCMTNTPTMAAWLSNHRAAMVR